MENYKIKLKKGVNSVLNKRGRKPKDLEIGNNMKKELENLKENTNSSPVLPSNINIELNSVQQKWNEVISFSQKNNCDWLKAWGMAYAKNPYIQNERLKAIKTSGNRFTREQLENMLSNPSVNEQSLRSASRYFYNTITPVMKLYNMYSDILTYRTYIKLNELISNVGDKVKKEYRQIANWLRGFNPERTFRDITLQSFIEGKKFYFLREDLQNNIIVLQPMPSDYCKVVHQYEGGWQYAFNMMYFLKVGASPAWFPPEFEEYLKEFYCYYNQEENTIVNIDNLPKDITAYNANRNWYFWKEIPIGKGWVFGLDDGIPEVMPPLSSMFLDANELNTYKLLEQELLSIPLKQIMTASVPLTKENKSGSYANDTAVTPDLIKLYQDIIQSILPQSVDFIAAPFDNFNVHTFDSVASKNSIVGDAMQNFYSQGGVSGLLTTTAKPNLSQVKIAQTLEAAFIDRIYGQYKYFLNYCLNNKGITNKFEIFIDGDRFSDKDKYATIEKALMNGQKDLLPEFLSFYNCYMDTAISTMELVEIFEYYEHLQPLISAYQMNQSENKNGRPETNLNKVESDATATSIEVGSNKAENRVTKFSLDNLNDKQKQEILEVLKDYGLEEEVNE